MQTSKVPSTAWVVLSADYLNPPSWSLLLRKAGGPNVEWAIAENRGKLERLNPCSVIKKRSLKVTAMFPNAVFACLLATAAIATLANPRSLRTIHPGPTGALEAARTLADLKNLISPRHCGDLLRAGQNISGVFTVFHRAAGRSGQNVYCDMDTDGGGWTAIVKRGQFRNNVFYFNRSWEEYASGFGDPAKEYWIGNRALHALTSSGETMSLRVVLINTTEDRASIDYASVRVDGEAEQFRLHTGTFLGSEGWDSLYLHNGMKFTTFDKDNDKADKNCAVTFRGGWWYENCYKSNLNGLNLNGHYDYKIGGIDWGLRGSVGGYSHSYPSALMLIRPADFESLS